MKNEIEVQKTPIHYVKIFFRRKRLFLIPLLIGLLAGTVAGFTLPKTYESDTVILVEEGKVLNPLIKGLAVSTSLRDRLQTLREQILSWDRLVQLTKRLDLAKGIKSQYDFEQLILDLRKEIIVTLRGPNLIRISYQSDDPEMTQKIVKTVTDIFVEENIAMQNRETESAITFINDQLHVYKRKIKESELAMKEDELKNLLVDSTELHPRVKELRVEIVKIQEEINTGNFEVKGTPQPSSPLAAKIQEEISRIQAESSTIDSTVAGASTGLPNEDLYNLLLLDKVSSTLGGGEEDSPLARDMDVNERIYNMLLQRLETAKITRRLEASQEGTRYSILDPARLPLRPVKPNKVLTSFLGLFLGALVGIGIIFCVEFFDRSFLSVEEASSFLSGPVLGAISRITTQEELELERKRRRLLGVPHFIHSFTAFFQGRLAFLRGK